MFWDESAAATGDFAGYGGGGAPVGVPALELIVVWVWLTVVKWCSGEGKVELGKKKDSREWFELATDFRVVGTVA